MSLHAGAARRDISPTKPLQLYGYPHVKRIFERIHDPLFASAVYLANGERSVVLIALDILMLEPPRARQIRARVAARLKIAEDGVFISCSHTHSGPVTTTLVGWKDNVAMSNVDEDYMTLVANGIVEAAAAAQASSRPAAFAWTTANGTGVGGNRLGRDGVTDSEVGVLALRDAASERLFAVAMVYGMHPTVIHEDTREVSSDFPGYTRLHLEEAFGDDLVVAYHSGPCGNQSPRYHVSGQTFAEAERLGRKLGESVRQSLAALTAADFSRDCALGAVLQEIEPPVRPMPSVADAEQTLADYRAEYDRLKRENAGHGPVRTAECAIFGAEGSLALAKAAAAGLIGEMVRNYRPIQLQALRIGDARLVGWPGECFVEYSLDLKRRAGGKVFVAAFVNGELQGYIVTPEAAAAGGYEATNAVFAPATGALMVETSLAMLAKL